MMTSTPHKSPFKFLDPYGKEDINFFFGRENEVEKLYQSVNKNRIVLVYGLSGTGKTSLVQCGLLDRFDVTEWVPFFVRRGCNINSSLKEKLIKSKAIGGGIQELQNPRSVVEYLKLISKRYLRNVFLVFDQFEELLILGDEEEKNEFIATLKEILSSEETQFCSFIFILREEYFAYLEIFEEIIHGFSDRRMRVEHMRANQVSEVITKSCEYFNIHFEKRVDNVKQIIHRLTEVSGIQLPYLQIYLDQLWRQDFDRTYPHGYPQNGFPRLEFTTREIETFGDIRDVTRRFLIERMEVIHVELKTKFPDIADNTLNQVLDAFVTEKGTKLPVSFTWKDEKRNFLDNAPKVLRSMDKRLLEFILDQLQYNRILRQDASTLELAHDNLAEYIYQQRPREQRRLDEIEKQIINRYDEFNQTKEYLTKKQVMVFEDVVQQLDLDKVHLKFFNDSKKYHERKSRLKIGLWVVGAIAVFYVFQLIQNSRASDRQYASLYLGFRIDAIDNKEDALRVAKYIYDKDLVSKEEKVIFKEKFLKIFQSKEIQGTFSNYKKTFRKTVFKPEDFDISEDGAYFAINISNSTERKKYQLYDTSHAGPIETFDEVEYAYFTNRPDILLVANSIPVYFSDQPIILNYANQFFLYNCKTRQRDTIFDGTKFVNEYFMQTDGLHSGSISNLSSEHDSYRVRYTNSNCLIIPFFRKSGETDPAEYKVKLLRPNHSSIVLSSNSIIRISKDGKYIMTGAEEYGIPAIKIYNEFGSELFTIKDVSFGDFTESGWVVYIREGTLGFRTESGDTTTHYAIHPEINYAYADKENKVALATSKNAVFLVNMLNGDIKKFNDTLVGIDFNNKTFISQPEADSANRVTLVLRDYYGNELGRFSISEELKQVAFNQQSGEVLVLTKSHRLFWLNNKLKSKSGFQLTTNDLLGFSKNGKIMYYIRDDYLNMYKSSGKLVDFSDFDAAYNWLNAKYKDTKVLLTKKDRDKYQLNFPSDNLWKGRN